MPEPSRLIKSENTGLAVPPRHSDSFRQFIGATATWPVAAFIRYALAARPSAGDRAVMPCSESRASVLLPAAAPISLHGPQSIESPDNPRLFRSRIMLPSAALAAEWFDWVGEPNMAESDEYAQKISIGSLRLSFSRI